MSHPAAANAEEMPTKPVDRVTARVNAVYRAWGRTTSVTQMRDDWEALFGSTAVPVEVEPVAIGELHAEWVTAPRADGDSDGVVLYLHGGGFQVGSTRSHRELMAGMSATSGCRVLGLDYRRAPEHRYPAALHDTLTAFDWLLDQGIAPGRIAFAGDSAGGGLAISALLALRDAGQALPAAAVLMSAWTDLTASGASYESRARLDPIHQRPMIVAMARAYLGTGADAHDARDPLVSPLFADLRGLPPMLIQVGDHETVLSDSTEFADRARAAGVLVQLEVWDDMVHVFQQFPADLVEARQALDAIGVFLRGRLPPTPDGRGHRP